MWRAREREKGYPCEKEPDTFSTFSISLLNGDVTKEADRFPASLTLDESVSNGYFFLYMYAYCIGAFEREREKKSRDWGAI